MNDRAASLEGDDVPLDQRARPLAAQTDARGAVPALRPAFAARALGDTLQRLREQRRVEVALEGAALRLEGRPVGRVGDEAREVCARLAAQFNLTPEADSANEGNVMYVFALP